MSDSGSKRWSQITPLQWMKEEERLERIKKLGPARERREI
jgi:hypothetical protein